VQIVQKVQSKFLHVSFVRSVSFNKNLHGDIDDIGDRQLRHFRQCIFSFWEQFLAVSDEPIDLQTLVIP
jgi:hypothetical protein